MTQENIYIFSLWLMLATAPLIFISLIFFPAPYGRYAQNGVGPMMPKRYGWCLMMAPAVFVMGYFYLINRPSDLLPYFFLLLWQIHYVHRAFIYPWELKNSKSGMSVLIVLSAFFFNSVNACANGVSLTLIHSYGIEWLYDPRFIAGTCLFFGGFWINLSSDKVLFSLRKDGEAEYKIPEGGLYRWISCPNYLGEMIEWTGWALATWSLAGLAFTVYTFANLVPRAFSHHRWYKEQFPDYPKNRRALF